MHPRRPQYSRRSWSQVLPPHERGRSRPCLEVPPTVPAAKHQNLRLQAPYMDIWIPGPPYCHFSKYARRIRQTWLRSSAAQMEFPSTLLSRKIRPGMPGGNTMPDELARADSNQKVRGIFGSTEESYWGVQVGWKTSWSAQLIGAEMSAAGKEAKKKGFHRGWWLRRGEGSIVRWEIGCITYMICIHRYFCIPCRTFSELPPHYPCRYLNFVWQILI